MREQEIEECTESKGIICGSKPNQKEKDDHERTHVPFRNWCKHCVFGRAKSASHEKDKEEEKGTPKISWDYMYMKDRGIKLTEEENGLPILVGIDSSSKMLFANVVPRKRENASMPPKEPNRI